MNSGCTKPFPWPRGKDTFHSIDQYPYEQHLRKNRREPVVCRRQLRSLTVVVLDFVCARFAKEQRRAARRVERVLAA